MEVVIAGAGSIGLLLGSFFAEAGMNVTCYVRRTEQAQQIQRDGIRRLNQDGTTSVFQAAATTHIQELPQKALWIVAVKYAGLRELLGDMERAGLNNPVLFVQNGIGHLALVNDATLSDVAFATVEHGAQRIDGCTVKHNGIGMLTVASARGNGQLFDTIGQLDSKNFPVSYHTNAEQILMRKVLINCMINPLTAILEVENGVLLTDAHCESLFTSLYAELIDAFPEMQAILPYEAVADVCRRTARNRSSMLADRLARRPMEIETIVTAVRQRAQHRGKSLSLLGTFEQLLYAMDRRDTAL